MGRLKPPPSPLLTTALNRCMFINMCACVHMHICIQIMCVTPVCTHFHTVRLFKFHYYTHVTHTHWLIYFSVLLVSCSQQIRLTRLYLYMPIHAHPCTTHTHAHARPYTMHTHTCTHAYTHIPYAHTHIAHTHAPHRGIICTHMPMDLDLGELCVEGCAYNNSYHLAHL